MINLALLVFAASAFASIPLSIRVPANSQRCFYGQVNQINSLVGFSYAVQTGGSFDIDFTVTSPDGEILHSETRQSQNDYSMKAQQLGEYKFCLSNDMSTFSDKFVEFEMTVDDTAVQASLPAIPKSDTGLLEQLTDSVESRILNLYRDLHYYKTRQKRNEFTVQSTESRIKWFSWIELFLMLAMAGLQVVIVQLFFKGSRRNLV